MRDDLTAVAAPQDSARRLGFTGTFVALLAAALLAQPPALGDAAGRRKTVWSVHGTAGLD